MEPQKRPLFLIQEEEKGIFLIEYGECLEMDLLVAKEIVTNRLEITKNQLHYIIYDMSNIKSLTFDAKEYLLSPNYGTKNILGIAFIAGNHVSVLLANILTKTSKNFPSKFFTKKCDALVWLKELKNT
ncbi:MAG TPA: hypothetical protein VLB84_17035 [Bacteroidia bacterium]|nr:hypothetical protein [Bacteroidia bacterium]